LRKEALPLYVGIRPTVPVRFMKVKRPNDNTPQWEIMNATNIVDFPGGVS